MSLKKLAGYRSPKRVLPESQWRYSLDHHTNVEYQTSSNILMNSYVLHLYQGLVCLQSMKHIRYYQNEMTSSWASFLDIVDDIWLNLMPSKQLASMTITTNRKLDLAKIQYYFWHRRCYAQQLLPLFLWMHDEMKMIAYGVYFCCFLRSFLPSLYQSKLLL